MGHVESLWQFDEGRNDFEGDYEDDAITKFVRANQLPLVVEFTQEVCFLLLDLCTYIIMECIYILM